MRPRASSDPPDARVTDTRRTVSAVWRIESARIVGALARRTGDFALAEDVAQEALAEALVSWPRDGVPSNPAGWLMTVAKRRAIDAHRRRSALDDRYRVLAHDADDSGAAADEAALDGDRIDDDVLALVFTACHPMVSPEARVALTLRVVGGLTSDEIAKAFLVPTATVQARITRAKKTLSAAQVRFELPPRDDWAERLSSVLSVVYVIFTEGSWVVGRFVDPPRPRQRGRATRPRPHPPRARSARSFRVAGPARTHRGAVPACGSRPRDGGPARRPGPPALRITRRRGAVGRRSAERRRSAGVSAPTACKRRSPSVMPSPRRSTQRTGTGWWCCTRRSGGWPPRRSSISTAP